MTNKINNDVYNSIKFIEDSIKSAMPIRKKTICLFLIGSFKDSNIDKVFSESKLYGKYKDENHVFIIVDKALDYLVDNNKIDYIDYINKKDKTEKIYYTKRFYNKAYEHECMPICFKLQNNIDKFKRKKDNLRIQFTYNDLIKLNESGFLSCMEEVYSEIDNNHDVSLNRKISWIDSFRIVKNLLECNYFLKDNIFMFEYKIETPFKPYYLDLIVQNKQEFLIIEFKQKEIKDVFNDKNIIKKAAVCQFYFQKNAETIVLCTHDQNTEYELKIEKFKDELFQIEIHSPNSLLNVLN